MHPTSIVRLTLVIVIVPSAASAQAAPTRTLTKPEATYAEGFTHLTALRELKDGRILTLDVSERSVQVIDLATGRAERVGRTGRGPGEYTYPVAFVTLGGDSIGVVDEPNGRILVIHQNGKTGGVIGITFSLIGEALETNLGGADARGSSYIAGRSYVTREGQLAKADSVPIRRWVPGQTRMDTVAWFREQATTVRAMSRGRGRGVAIIGPGFAGQDQWAVSADGRVAVAHPEPYQIEWFDSTGRRTLAPPIPITVQRFTEAHKEEWRARNRGGGLGTAVGDGQITTYRERAGRPPDPKWPDVLPPFLRNQGRALTFAPDGNLWIRRTGPAGIPPTFDVINREGRVVEQVVLPKRTRLVAFGARGAVYVARIDDDDVQYLERYRLGDAR
jgi:hypothetical protein